MINFAARISLLIIMIKRTDSSDYHDKTKKQVNTENKG